MNERLALWTAIAALATGIALLWWAFETPPRPDAGTHADSRSPAASAAPTASQPLYAPPDSLLRPNEH